MPNLRAHIMKRESKMPDYIRLVSYIYNYEEGLKRNNVGYTRVEARNGQCKCTLHIAAPSLNDKQLKAYIFRRSGDGIQGILLGTLQIKNGMGDFRTVTDSSHIMNSVYGINEMGGILLYYTDAKFFATEWDDIPVTREMAASIEKSPDGGKSVTGVEEETERDVGQSKQQVSSAVTAPEEELPEEMPELESVSVPKELAHSDNERAAEEKEFEELRPEREKYFDSIDNPDTAVKADTAIPQESVEETGSGSGYEADGMNKCRDSYSDTSREQAGRVPYDRRNQPYGIGNNKVIFEDHPLAKRIYKTFPRMYPFEDNDVAWCVKIEPQDIGLFPMDAWVLGNNSFLLHGYYSYRHLIFARINDRNGINYIIGVPGVYHNREKFMAKMFGFENFKCVKRKELRTGEFGYWYIPIVLH